MCKSFSSPSQCGESGMGAGKGGSIILEGTFWTEHSGRNILEGIEAPCLVGGSDSGLHVNAPSSKFK